MTINVDTPIDVETITDFVHHEAELADEHRLEEWLALWNPERARYTVPYPGPPGGGRHVAIIRDDHARLQERIRRLLSGSAHAQDPPSKLCRVIGRVTVRDGEAGSVVATSKFVCVESRPNRETLWAGTMVHTLAHRAGTDELELWQKEVHLVNAESEIPALAFLI